MLRQNQRIGIRGFYHIAEVSPELVVELGAMSQIRRHVQTPSVGVVGRGYPLSPNLKNIPVQLRGTLIVEFRQRVIVPPTLIAAVIRPLVLVLKPEIVCIGTVLGQIRPRRVPLLILVDFFPIHPLVERSAVIEHTIQNHTNPPRMGLSHQTDKQPVGGLQISLVCHPLTIFRGMPIVTVSLPQALPSVRHNLSIVGIDGIIIRCVILVVGGRDKQRVKVDNLNTQTLEIIQFLPDSLQIPSIKLGHIKICRILIPVFHPACHGLNIAVFPIFHVVRAVAIAEPVHQNLVHDRSLCPVGRGKSRYHKKRILLTHLGGHSDSVIKIYLSVLAEFKIIGIPLILQLNRDSVVVKFFSGKLQCHGKPFLLMDQTDLRLLSPGHAEADLHLIVDLRFPRNTVFSCSVAKNCFFFHFIYILLHFPVNSKKKKTAVTLPF